MTPPRNAQQTRRRVVYAFPTSLRLRAAFHEKLRERLARDGVIYDFVYSSGDPDLGKDDTVVLPWATVLATSLTSMNRPRPALAHWRTRPATSAIEVAAIGVPIASKVGGRKLGSAT